MKFFIVITLMLVIAGCVYPARYVELEQGRYQVTSFGSTLGSVQTYLNRIESRAKKICGEAGFEYEDKVSAQTKSTVNSINSQLVNVSHNQVSRVVVCNELKNVVDSEE